MASNDRIDMQALEASVIELMNDRTREARPEEARLSAEHGALPLGFDLWSWVLLHPGGVVITEGWEPKEIERSRDPQRLINALVWGAERYPALAKLIPSRKPGDVECDLCRGSKQWGDAVGASKQPKICPRCGGLGWLVGLDA